MAYEPDKVTLRKCIGMPSGMKRLTAMACVAVLVGCVGPQISVTDASSRQVGFLVQNAALVPMRVIDDRAASYCQQHGLAYRRTDTAWITPTLKRVAYDCDWVKPLPQRKPEVAHTPARAAQRVTAKPASADMKMAAWTKAKAATAAWALCLRYDAEQKAKATTESPRNDRTGGCEFLLRAGARGA